MLKLKGFSLIEAIVYLAIASIVLMIIADIFIIQGRVFDRESGQTDIDLYTKTALHKIVAEGLSANTVVKERVFGGTNFMTGDQTLILELPSLDNNQNILPNTYDYLVVYLDPSATDRLYLQIDAATSTGRQDKTILLANFVNNLNFRYNDSDPIQAKKIDVTITVEKTVRNQKLKSENTISLFLKNKL